MRKLTSGSFCIPAGAAVRSAPALRLPARAGRCGFLTLAEQTATSWLSQVPSWSLDAHLLGALWGAEHLGRAKQAVPSAAPLGLFQRHSHLQMIQLCREESV